jgi:ketosteroid isomerase-like protein
MDPTATERQFFQSLREADTANLEHVLADDFLLIDVMSGTEISKPALLEAVRSAQVKFESIDVFESRERRYPGTAVITGRTRMRGRFGEVPFSANSRYTHVYIEQHGGWRLVAAQGTSIAS